MSGRWDEIFWFEPIPDQVFLENHFMIEEYIPLAPLTTFHIGGPARYFMRARTQEDIREALDFVQAQQVPLFVLGGGSNLLISDQGFPGLVLKIDCDGWQQDGTSLTLGAGLVLLDVVRFAAEHALAGIELLAGVPGLLGGAVRGNAGAFGQEIGQVVREVTAFDRNTHEIRVFTQAECTFAYRQSFFKQHPEWVIIQVTLSLVAGERETLLTTVSETLARRQAKHPQDMACAGSFFMNPVVTNTALRAEFEHDKGVVVKDDRLPAGWLIEQAGLKGRRIGGAMVSDIQANYIINTGTATAEDVIMLASVIKQKVRTELGVQLTEEVQMVGF
jgi:UDP-N-acetylmuramate dehydrogenase